MSDSFRRIRSHILLTARTSSDSAFSQRSLSCKYIHVKPCVVDHDDNILGCSVNRIPRQLRRYVFADFGIGDLRIPNAVSKGRRGHIDLREIFKGVGPDQKVFCKEEMSNKINLHGMRARHSKECYNYYAGLLAEGKAEEGNRIFLTIVRLLLGIYLIVSVAVSLVMILVDIVYALFDPRIRFE